MKNLVIILAIGSILGIVALFATSTNDYKKRSLTFPTNTRGLSEAKNSSVVELKNGDTFELIATPIKKNLNGSEIRMLAYNGSVPGPTIKVAQGSTVTIKLINKTDVETTLHSHGLRLKNAFDGTPGITQKPVAPGDAFTYQLTFPDPGTYWYHPHIREDYAQELGLYGSFLVTPKDPSYWNDVTREIPLFLDDIAMENGSITPFQKNYADHALMGRFGNTMLVNGATDYRLQVNKGDPVRLSLINAANVRPFRFAIEGATMKVVGGDSGAYEREYWEDSIVIGPSERAIVEVSFPKTGAFAMQNKTPDKTIDLGMIVVTGNTSKESVPADWRSLPLRNYVPTIRSIDPFRSFFSKAPDKQIALSVNMAEVDMGGGHMMSDGSMMGGVPEGGIEWNDDDGTMANLTTKTVSWNITDLATKKQNMDIKWKFKVGDKVKIRIVNDAHSMHPMQHPIHFHGQRFLVINKNGTPATNLVWKDTVLVPAGEYVDILLDATNPGTWMAHCHIPEHLEAGMMFSFTVENQ